MKSSIFAYILFITSPFYQLALSAPTPGSSAPSQPGVTGSRPYESQGQTVSSTSLGRTPDAAYVSQAYSPQLVRREVLGDDKYKSFGGQVLGGLEMKTKTPPGASGGKLCPDCLRYIKDANWGKHNKARMAPIKATYIQSMKRQFYVQNKEDREKVWNWILDGRRVVKDKCWHCGEDPKTEPLAEHETKHCIEMRNMEGIIQATLKDMQYKEKRQEAAKQKKVIARNNTIR